MRRPASALLLALAAVAGCRAVAATPEDAAMEADLYVVRDLAGGDAEVDAGCPLGPEICDDKCDNDRNGYIDRDDPACTPIVIAGIGSGDAVRLALVAGAPTLKPFLTFGNWTGSAAYRRDITAGEAWVSRDGITKLVERRRIDTGAQTWSRTDTRVRDVCFFDGKVVLVETMAASGVLHILAPDGSDMTTVAVAAGAPAACASDGKLLYVPVHLGNNRSVFLVYDKQLAQSPIATLPIPPFPSLMEDRCLDLAWTKDGFFGLFEVANPPGDFDSNGSAGVVYPFAMDGGVGAAIAVPGDGGMVHSLGEFVP